MHDRETFERYAVIPLALPQPPVDLEAFKEFVQNHCEQCAFRGNDIRYVLFYMRKPMRRGKVLLHAVSPDFRDIGPSTRYAWDPVFAERFPALCAWAERLPFRRLGLVCVITQTADVREHVDILTDEDTSATLFERFREVEPRFYRVILGDSADTRNRSFYVTTKYGGKKRYVRMPEETSTIALSSSTCYHGADFRKGKYKSTIVFYGDLDADRHRALLQRSVRRFPRHLISTARVAPVDGPAMERPYRGAE